MMESDIPSVTVIGVIACEGIEERTDSYLKNISCSMRHHFQSGTIRTHTHQTTTATLQFSAVRSLSLEKTEVTDGTINPTINSELDPIRGMIRRAIFESKSDILNQYLFFVCNSVAVLVDISTEVRRMEQIKAIVIPDQAAW